MSSSFTSVFLSGPSVFSENDEPHESMTPQTSAVSFQTQGKSLCVSEPSEGRLLTSTTFFSSASGRTDGTTTSSVEGASPALAVLEDITATPRVCGAVV